MQWPVLEGFFPDSTLGFGEVGDAVVLLECALDEWDVALGVVGQGEVAYQRIEGHGLRLFLFEVFDRVPDLCEELATGVAYCGGGRGGLAGGEGGVVGAFGVGGLRCCGTRWRSGGRTSVLGVAGGGIREFVAELVEGGVERHAGGGWLAGLEGSAKRSRRSAPSESKQVVDEERRPC